MAATLTGIIVGMRAVEGVVKEGPRAGESWQFLSMEINDIRYGRVWSCQLRHDDKQYEEVARADLKGHKVKVTIASQTAGERELADGRKVLQIRSQITNLRDLGTPDDDDE